MSQYCDHIDVAFCERDSFEAIFDDAPDYVGFAQAVTSTRILGYFASVEALTEAVPNPNIGDTYGIGDEAPYNLYVYSANGWIDNGVPGGPPGPPGPQGNDGAQGPPGPAAAVTAWEVRYQASASGTTIPTGTWSVNIPEVPDGQFLWTRTQVTYSDGTTTTSYSVVRGAGGGAVTRDAIIDALGYTPADDTTAMNYKILTFDGSAFKDADGNTLTYAQIKAFCLDTKNFVYAQYSNRLYIPQYISGNNIFFESSYIDSDIPYMHRLGINNANQTSNQTIRLTKSTETTAIADRVTTVEAGLDEKINHSDALTFEEIAASTDLSGKVASAEAVKGLIPKPFTVSGTDDFVIDLNNSRYITDKAVLLCISGHATANLSGAHPILFDRRASPGAIFAGYKGTRWDITQPMYCYIGTTFIAIQTLNSGEYLHIYTIIILE